MLATVNESTWRLLVGAAPLAGLAAFVWAAAQGEVDVQRSPTLHAALAGVAAVGATVACWTARQLRPRKVLSVAQATRLAQSGLLGDVVAMRGRALALPGAVPLVSPDGELCVWFERRADGGPAAQASTRPFLLEDDHGARCLVLAAGAQVGGRPPVAAGRAGERLLRAGDRVEVIGRFVAASTESLALQSDAALLARRCEALPGPLAIEEPRLADLRAAARADADPRPLPVLAPLSGQGALQVRVGPDGNESALYGLLALADCLVLVVVASLALQALR